MELANSSGIRERTRAGLDAAKARGGTGGQFLALSLKDIAAAKVMLYNPGLTVEEEARVDGKARADDPVSVRLKWMIVDCLDPERLAAFWGALLGRRVRKRRGPYVFLATGRSGGYHLGFQQVAEPKIGKNRVHPDLICDDVHVTAARVEALGGTRVQSSERSGFLVMADPEGNEFCMLPQGPLHMDEEGNAHYLDS